MGVEGIAERVRARIERKMERVAERLSELSDDAELRSAQDKLAQELAALDAEIETLSVQEVVPPGALERLEARRERLLSRQEHLDLKLEILEERRERLRESLGEMRASVQEARDDAVARARVAATRARERPRQSAQPRKMEEERRKILEMVSDGTITADEAAQLLDALRTQEEAASRSGRRPRWVRIRITDTDDNTVRVNLTLPVGLVRAGLRAGGSIAGVEGLDTAGLEDMLDRGEIGHILDIRDAADGERVEIFVE